MRSCLLLLRLGLLLQHAMILVSKDHYVRSSQATGRGVIELRTVDTYRFAAMAAEEAREARRARRP